MKLRMVIAITFLVCVGISASAQTSESGSPPPKARGDYVRCQFGSEQENAWLQQPRLESAKQAVRKVVNTLDIKGALGIDKQAALMRSVETAASGRELQTVIELATQDETLKAERGKLTQAATKALAGVGEPPATPLDVASSQSISQLQRS